MAHWLECILVTGESYLWWYINMGVGGLKLFDKSNGQLITHHVPRIFDLLPPECSQYICIGCLRFECDGCGLCDPTATIAQCLRSNEEPCAVAPFAIRVVRIWPWGFVPPEQSWPWSLRMWFFRKSFILCEIGLCLVETGCIWSFDRLRNSLYFYLQLRNLLGASSAMGNHSIYYDTYNIVGFIQL